MTSKNSNNKNILIVSLVSVVLIIIFSFYLQNVPNKFSPPSLDSNYSQEYIHGKILNVSEKNEDHVKNLNIEMLFGEEKGKIRNILFDEINNLNDYKKGDTVTIYKNINTSTGDVNYDVVDFYHFNGVFWMFLIFVIVALIVAGRKGLMAIFSVVATLGFFYFFFLKLIGIGISPVFSVVLFITIVTFISIPLIHGLNRKSLSSIIAIFIGYAGSIIVVYIFNFLAQLGSAPSDDFRLLGTMYGDIDLEGLLLASIFLGAVGALIDTAISISSAIFETLQDSPNLNFSKVYKIGMNVGKDVLGSMINTLLFAYIASALPFLVLLSISYEGDNLFYNLINMDFVALELTRTFVGAVSLVMLIPLVSATSAYYLIKKSN